MRARRGLPGPAPLAAALAVALLALAVAIGVLQLRGDPEPVKPKVIRHLQGQRRPVVARAAGFGAGWAADPVQRRGPAHRPEDAQGHRTDPARHGEVQVADRAGAVWALVGRPADRGRPAPSSSARIDPRTNRVVARIPMRRPDGDNFAPLSLAADRDHVWVIGAQGALRIDPATNARDRFVAYGPRPRGARASERRRHRHRQPCPKRWRRASASGC